MIEDDAQEGPDHVDAHRTVAQVISPYTQTGKVDSTFYSQVSVLRTIEQIVGLAPMTQFDAAATPMLNSFTDTPNMKTYTAIVPTQNVQETNPVADPHFSMYASLADSATAVDQNEKAENLGLWASVHGYDSPMPAPQSNLHLDGPTIPDASNSPDQNGQALGEQSPDRTKGNECRGGPADGCPPFCAWSGRIRLPRMTTAGFARSIPTCRSSSSKTR